VALALRLLPAPGIPIFAFRLAALVRGLGMGRPGGPFQNPEARDQAGDYFFNQPGFLRLEISSLILDYNSFARSGKAGVAQREAKACQVTAPVFWVVKAVFDPGKLAPSGF
jgi:hypothetical protein